MKRILMSAACAASLMGGVALAEDESPWSVSGTVGVTSNYMFRGISQSDGEPAFAFRHRKIVNRIGNLIQQFHDPVQVAVVEVGHRFRLMHSSRAGLFYRLK